jgi:hypothetical protein
MRALTVFDQTIFALNDNGVMVILNNHINDAIWCCSSHDANGLWYNANYTESDWLDTLFEMTSRYSQNEMVIGVDLRNEIREDKVNK